MELKSNKVRADWVCFFLFLAANILLAQGPFSLTIKLWVGLLGLAGPFLWALYERLPAPKTSRPFYLQEFLPPASPWLWGLILAGGIFLRFYKLTSLSTWPNPDESLFAFIAFHISRYGDNAFFYTYAQHPFTFLWGLALFIRIFGLSLASLWAFPAAISCLSVPLGYFAARQFFSRSLSLLLAVFFAFSYWGIYAGRIACPTALCPLAELPVLYLFGKFLSGGPPKANRRDAILLGLAIGLGFYAYPPAWAPLAFWFVATVLKISLGRGEKSREILYCFGSALSLLLLPFMLFALKENYGSYIGDIAVRHPARLSAGQIQVSLSYLSGLFWGKMEGDYYGPYWGGLFDPVSGSLFFLGLLQCWRNRGDKLIRWSAVASVLSLLPGVGSGNLEFFRIFFIFPFFLLFVVFGMQRLLSGLTPKNTVLFCGVFFLAAIPANLYHLFGAYQDYWKNPGPSWGFYKSPENFRAYQILQKLAADEGPGYVFTNFPSDMADQSLMVASYPFNCALNPQTAKHPPQWFAAMANDNYGPFLLQRFPGGKWFSLSRDLDRKDGGLGLGLFPLGSLPSQTLKSWLDADRAFAETTYAFLNRPTGTDYQRVFQALGRSEPLIRGDPFLESCFWEKAYYLYLQNSAFGDKRKAENFKHSLEALRRALGQGYPAAHLLNEYGAYLMMMGDRSGAAKSFEKSLQANPAFEPAQGNLKILLDLNGGGDPQP
jgi:tetratricopeptide (TPR) repeat protein